MTFNNDLIGEIEQEGVEYISEDRRTSSPRNVLAVFVGAGCSFPMIVFGWLPVSFGLDFTSAVTSVCLGIALATLLVLPLGLLGPQTGTNMTVASSAFFGIRGRFIGTAISLITAVVYAAITVWTCGDALVAAAHRLAGLPDNGWSKAGAYGLITMLMVPVAIYGHATIVSMQKIVAPLVALIFCIGFIAFAPGFSPENTAPEFILGGYWQTWLLSFVIGFAGPFSYVPVISDYTRRISLKKHNARSIVTFTGLGIFLANAIPPIVGIVFAMSLAEGTTSFVDGLIAQAPVWYLLPIFVTAVLGGMSQGVLNLYASGLDLEGLFPSLSRAHTTAITSVAAVILLYAGVFVWNAVEAVAASALLLNAVGAPWAAILIIGTLKNYRSGYNPDDLQAFVTGRRSGRYWYTGGWNIPAVCAWLLGSVFGALTIQTPGYYGPFADVAAGIDISAVGAVFATAAIYVALTRLMSPRAAQSASAS